MRFQVPQFIDVEDKIFGPLTFKQFIYLAGGAGLCVIAWTLLPTFVAVLIDIPAALFAIALAFYKVNDKPFVNVVEAAVKYFFGPKLYIWKKEPARPAAESKAGGEHKADAPQVYVPKLSESKLKDLTWSLDVKDQENPVTDAQASR